MNSNNQVVGPYCNHTNPDICSYNCYSRSAQDFCECGCLRCMHRNICLISSRNTSCIWCACTEFRPILWTREMLDAAKQRGKELYEFFGDYPTDRQDDPLCLLCGQPEEDDHC